ncbi:MAG: TraB/GumN family protein [Gammaproteobacteria bacterium]|nr:TraB/GumN family protein [Gammaproteobacteria bacterium]
MTRPCAVGVLLALGCLLGFSSVARPTVAANAIPAGLVWQIDGPKGRVYLAGSMHLLRRDRPALPPAIDAAYREAESLVMEIDADALDEQKMAALMLRTSSFTDGRSLPLVAGENRWKIVRDLLAKAQVPEAFAASLEPWGATILLTTLEYARLGFDPELGVEKQLQQRAARDQKEIDGLETAEFQLSLLDSLPLAKQLQLLDVTLAELDDMPSMVDDLYAAWRSGDVRRLDELLLEGYRETPNLYDDLVDRRNRNWVPQVKALLERDEDTLVVVGALHLVGERGLIGLLEREGLRPRPYRP